jgi:hypothetical protein
MFKYALFVPGRVTTKGRSTGFIFLISAKRSLRRDSSSGSDIVGYLESSSEYASKYLPHLAKNLGYRCAVDPFSFPTVSRIFSGFTGRNLFGILSNITFSSIIKSSFGSLGFLTTFLKLRSTCASLMKECIPKCRLKSLTFISLD